ncbi:hypothetical protein PSHT_06616 [Puccinia striiformis]|uniref:Uncharacterized protein n=1 Tax=Puccinia striiformis TaxID=27350 RepID=A0A2S4W479_9BASI|nr:hypothetical protein PSHT_06616 [Puccinia striiformis]
MFSTDRVLLTFAFMLREKEPSKGKTPDDFHQPPTGYIDRTTCLIHTVTRTNNPTKVSSPERSTTTLEQETGLLETSLANRFHYLLQLQHPRFNISDRYSTSYHTRTLGRNLVTLECDTRQITTSRYILDSSDIRYYTHRFGCTTYRRNHHTHPHFLIICSFAHLHEYRLNQTLETISLLTISPNLTPPTTQLQSRSSSTNSQSNNHNNNDHSSSRNYSSSNPISLSYPHQPIDIIESHNQQSRLSRTIYHPSGSPLLQLSSIDNKDENGGCDHELLSNQKIDRLKLLIGIAYGSTSGTLSGICLLFAKTGVELLIKSLTGTVNEFAKIQTWLILFVLLVSALLQLWYLNKALRLVNPTLICPLAFCFYNLSSIISSLVYYDQLKLLSNFQIFAISTGTIILLGGVWVVSIGTTTNNNNTHNTLKQLDDQEEEEGRVNENEEEEEEEEDHHNENEATPLLPSSSKIGGGHSSEEEEEEEQELSEEYTEDSIGMDDATSSLKPEDHRRPSYNNSRRNTLLLHPPTASTSTTTGSSSNHRLSQDNCRRRSSFQTAHPFDHLIRQFMADGDVTPVRGFSIGLGAASPGFAIRPKKRLARKSGDGYLIGRSSLSRHSHERDLHHHHHLSHQSSPAQRQQQQQPEQEQEDHEEEQPNQEQQTQDPQPQEQSQWELHQHRQASLEPDRDHPPDPHRHSYS